MKIQVFSDIHGDVRTLEKLLAVEADYYFAAGDMVSWSKGLDRIGKVLSQRGDRVYVLPGNHESEDAIARMCETFSLNAFHGQTIEADGVQIAGLGYSNPTPFNTPGEYTEQELADRLAGFAKLDPLVLVCHCPPRDTALDRTSGGRHCGSQAIRDFIEQRQPRFFFCGHIHESQGLEDQIGRSRGVNVGKEGYLLDLDTIAI